MSTALATLTNSFAARFGIESNQQELIETLKATAFKGGNVTDAQMTALMLVAQQYNLNPWLKEIYAFPDKGGIVPIVGVDGWARIMNDHPQFDGMEFAQDADSCTCIIYRKDRAHPTKATEYMEECRRSNSGPWGSHPRRMLRHKAMIQCARLAFGFGGIYDQDEAERIVDAGTIDNGTGAVADKKPSLIPMTDAGLSKLCADKVNDDGVITKMGYRSMIQCGDKTPDDLILYLAAKYLLEDSHVDTIKSWAPIEGEKA